MTKTAADTTAANADAANATAYATKSKKKTTKTNGRGYGLYIHKVGKRIAPTATISAAALDLVNELVMQLETRVSRSAFEMAAFSKKSTLSARHVQTATKLIFPREMGGLAIGEGTKATTRFFS